MSKVFVDTNILVHAADMNDSKKRKSSRDALLRLEADSAGVISTQVLQELYVVLTRKLGIEPLLAKGIVHNCENFEVVVVDPALIKDAIDCSVLNKISFWDALTVVSAERANCKKIWTEDLSPGQTINGISIENPLQHA